jgi:pimeloyl-ACP methyl ester carboxylesterase
VIRERAVRSEGQVAFWHFAHGPDWAKVIDADTEMLKGLTAAGGQWLGQSLERAACPVFMTASLEDAMLIDPVRYILEMLKKLRDGRAFISAKGGHPLIWTAPEEFRAAVRGFLSQFLEKQGD